MEDSKALETAADDELVSETIDSLGSTVGNFANRIARKLREQEVLEDHSQKVTEQRQGRVLQAIATIRKVLNETRKIKLGKRFFLDLRVDDWEGWPRIELNLIDNKMPERIDYGLLVSANDRRERGTVRIALRSGQLLGHFELAEPEEMKRIPLVLKKSVRSFLDAVAEYVLNPVKPSETIEEQTKNLDAEKNEAPPDVHARQLAKENLFSEDIYSDENRVSLNPNEANPLEALNLELLKKKSS